MKLLIVLSLFILLFTQNLEARFYNPKIGKFANSDPIMPNSNKPQALNPYAYNFNNPLKYVDPSGHVPVLPRDTQKTQEPVESGTLVLRDRSNGLKNEGKIVAESLSKFVKGYARIISKPIYVDAYTDSVEEEGMQVASHYELQYLEYKKPDGSPVGKAWANLKLTLDLSRTVAQTLGRSPTTIVISDFYRLPRNNPSLFEITDGELGRKGDLIPLDLAFGATYNKDFPLQDVVVNPDLLKRSRRMRGYKRRLIFSTVDSILYHEYVGHVGLALYNRLVYSSTQMALSSLGIPTPNIREDHNTRKQDRAGLYDQTNYLENVGRAAWDHLYPNDKIGQVTHWHKWEPLRNWDPSRDR